MSTQTPIVFATDTSRDYETIAALVLNQRGIGKNAQKPVGDVVATVRIDRNYVDLNVPDGVYSRPGKDGRIWRTPADVGAREQAWRARLKLNVASLAERL